MVKRNGGVGELVHGYSCYHVGTLQYHYMCFEPTRRWGQTVHRVQRTKVMLVLTAFSSYLVVNEEFEPVLGIVEFQQTLEEDCDKRCRLLNENANHNQRVFVLL